MSNANYLPFNFLGLEPEESDFENSKVVILPVPYERTVSFGRGTSKGPNSIIYASRSLELYDDELGIEPYEIGIHTMPELETNVDPKEMVESLSSVCSELLDKDKFIITLGGEHSITFGAVQAHKKKFGDFSVLNIDAHCDLRDSYEGTKFNHACVMRRVSECGLPVTEVGIRSYSKEESEYIKEAKNVKIFHAREIHEMKMDKWVQNVLSTLKSKVYLSIDMDGFDPSIVPGTGTPEPGGLDWSQVIRLITEVFCSCEVVGMDIVELSPIAGITGPDVLAAKLAYKSVGYKFKKSFG
ncbi:MAG: agmatinase [Thermodesulfobacteriota bacterium]